MPPPSIIRHIHLPSITPFHLVQSLQQHLVGQFLTHKAASSTRTSPSNTPPPPAPTIITFVPTPVYTTGRREHDSLSAAQQTALKQPLSPLHSSYHNRFANPEWPEVVSTLRGGQTTWHGPGQLVVYPILDLKPVPFTPRDGLQDGDAEVGRDEEVEEGQKTPVYDLWPKGLSVRCYVHLLESSTIATLGHWNLTGIRTSNPGVWEASGERKIAALGVHLRRNITSYGVGLNVYTDLRWFDRIVACGLVGKGVVSMKALGRETGAWSDARAEDNADEVEREVRGKGLGLGREGRRWLDTMGRKSGSQLKARLKPSIVGRTWVREFARGLLGEEGEERVVKVELEELGLPEEFVLGFRRETAERRRPWDEGD